MSRVPVNTEPTPLCAHLAPRNWGCQIGGIEPAESTHISVDGCGASPVHRQRQIRLRWGMPVREKCHSMVASSRLSNYAT